MTRRSFKVGDRVEFVDSGKRGTVTATVHQADPTCAKIVIVKADRCRQSFAEFTNDSRRLSPHSTRGQS